MKKLMTTWVMAILLAGGLRADIKVSDVEVFSGYPWKEVVVAYTITGTDDNAEGIYVTATDKSANKSYETLVQSCDKRTEGRHVLRWNAASEGVKFSSANVVFSVSVANVSVQLWKNGPYWAECNVGATKPEDYGYYFWWGGTVGYKCNAADNGWVSVQDGSSFSFYGKNCPTIKTKSQLQSEGYIDSTGNLVASHDAATAHLGAPWRIPTKAEFIALLSNCDTNWLTRNGVYGCRIKGRGEYSAKSIFLPAAGHGDGTDLYAGSLSLYWSSTPHSDYMNKSWNLEGSKSGNFYLDYIGRQTGLPVRPVRGFAQ